jgi:hypothetical protein
MRNDIPEELLLAIDNADVVVFEGFEMTGKSYLAKQVNQKYASILYRPDWEGAMTDNVVRRGNRFIPGLAILGLWKQLSASVGPKRLLIDRWMAVSYVYQIQYNQPTDAVSLDELVKAHILAADGLNLVMVHKQHSSVEEARDMYELSLKSSDHSDIYDRFNSFEDYYEAYRKFNDSYLKFYEEC